MKLLLVDVCAGGLKAASLVIYSSKRFSLSENIGLKSANIPAA